MKLNVVVYMAIGNQLQCEPDLNIKRLIVHKGSSGWCVCVCVFDVLGLSLLFQQVYFTLVCHYCFQKWCSNL